MKLYTIETEHFKLDGGAMFGVVPKVLWNKQYPANDNNLCTWAMRCLLIEDGKKKILIDSGIGNKQDAKFFQYYYLSGVQTLEKSLQRHGFQCDDITDVICTHLHFDHCGGCVRYSKKNRQLELTFKNAQYHVSKRQWDTATNPNNREKASFLSENFLPIQKKDQLSFVEKSGELFQNVHCRLFDGHTSGQIIPLIEFKDLTIVFTADLIPSTIHIPLPYIMSYDMQPLVTLKEKEALLTEAQCNNYLLFFEHDAYYESCFLNKTKKGIRVDRRGTLNDFIISDT